MLIADPDITYYNLKKGCKFIILATDGLWDVFTGLPYFQKHFTIHVFKLILFILKLKLLYSYFNQFILIPSNIVLNFFLIPFNF